MRMVVYAPRASAQRGTAHCEVAIREAGHDVVGVVVDGRDEGSWAAAEAMLDRGEADRIVVARWDHVPPEVLPHVWVVGH